MTSTKLGIAGRLARAFIDSKLTPLMLVAALLLGAAAVWLLPREEEPQIIVPMVDVFVRMEGSSPREVEARVTRPLERLLQEVAGVEYVYSTSSPGLSLVIVRFAVGEDEQRAMVRLQEKLQANYDIIPPGASPPLVKRRSIDDVPVLALTLTSARYSSYELRRLAAELLNEVKDVDGVSEVALIGGERRTVRVLLDPERLAAHAVSPIEVVAATAAANNRLTAGDITADHREIVLEAGTWLGSGKDVGDVVVGVHAGRPVFLRSIARIEDGPEEPSSYVRYLRGSGDDRLPRATPAVTLTVAKHGGENAVMVVEAVRRKIDALRGTLVPSDVELVISRDYGATANEKSNELLLHMAIAVVSVGALIWFALGRRESLIVMLAIPATLALTLTVFYLYGYTLNRITLFALIFSIGILVDDAIVVVENVVRHARMPENRGTPLREIAVRAVDEVGNPTILATMTVIAAILPMAVVGGLMGPYMRPIPIGATAAMVFSLLVAFVLTPWAAVRLLRIDLHGEHAEESRVTMLYRRVMGGLLSYSRRRTIFLTGVVVALVAAMSLVGIGWVKVKMLPFDNKSEMQVIIDMPEGTPLESTDRAAQLLADATRADADVTAVVSYSGVSGPYNFNGLVRHYFGRRGANVADLHVMLRDKSDRSAQSHTIAKRLRAALAPVAAELGARIKVAEVPPGPPVLQTMVAEVYGPDYERQIALGLEVRRVFETTPGLVDVDWYVEDPQPKTRVLVDREKAALAGVSELEVARALRIITNGEVVGLAHDEREREDLAIVVQTDRATRADLEHLLAMPMAGARGARVSIGELVELLPTQEDHAIYHKNLMPVVYVTADVAGEIESPVYAMLALAPKIDALELPGGYHVEQRTASQPFTSEEFALKWDGEWHITYEVFRDLGTAFAAVLLLIYVLNVAWFQSFRTPLVIMSAIPFSLVGILPAHGMMNAFFSATSMIGFIAGAGIVVRNSIILVDFIEQRLKEGAPLQQAVVDAGAVRFRPMLLTAAAVVVGAFVILFDPIFQGLAIALMAGEVASLLLSRMTVPIAYFLLRRRIGLRAVPEPPRGIAAVDTAEELRHVQ